MAASLRVAGRTLGESSPVFVIAEIGCNHENNFDRCLEMIRSAARSGADAVKLQTFDAEKLVTRDAPKFWDIPGAGATQYEEFAQCQPRFTDGQYRQMMELAAAEGILLFSTPTDESAVDFLDSLGVALFKVASMDITHLPLIRHIARKGKPVILSTGASFLQEVHQAVETLREEGNSQIALLHCVSLYPAPEGEINLRMMSDLAREFPDCVIGYSDHTRPGEALDVPTLAVAAGAKLIEKHFTFDRSRHGYDHEISADYETLRRMVAEFRRVEKVLGRSPKAPVGEEERTRRWGRRSVVTVVDITRGEKILPEMLAIKRPGTGIAPQFIASLYGKTAARDIPKDEVFTWDLVS